MATVSVNFRMDEQLKRNMEEICAQMGMTMTTAITIFCRKVEQERRIPFNITADPELEPEQDPNDPFYSESNIRYLKEQLEGIRSGRIPLEKHELSEAE